MRTSIPGSWYVHHGVLSGPGAAILLVGPTLESAPDAPGPIMTHDRTGCSERSHGARGGVARISSRLASPRRCREPATRIRARLSSFRRAEEVPPVAGDVEEHGDPAVDLGAWLGDELDAGRHHSRVGGVEVVDPEEEPDAAGDLVADASA